MWSSGSWRAGSWRARVRRGAGRVGARPAAAGAGAWTGPDAGWFRAGHGAASAGRRMCCCRRGACLRRADAGAVIGAALEAAAAGAGHRTIAVRLGRPASTVRGWLRRFAARAEEVRAFFTVLLAWTGPDPVMPARRRPGGRGGVGGRGCGCGGGAALAAGSARCRCGRRRRRPAAGCCWRRAGRVRAATRADPLRAARAARDGVAGHQRYDRRRCPWWA